MVGFHGKEAVANQLLLWAGVAVGALASASTMFSETTGGLMASPAVSDTSLWVGLGGLIAALTGLVRVWRSPDTKIAEVRLKESIDHHAEVIKLINETNAGLREEISRLRDENLRLMQIRNSGPTPGDHKND